MRNERKKKNKLRQLEKNAKNNIGETGKHKEQSKRIQQICKEKTGDSLKEN